jgi:hypothetical protein
VLQGHAARLTGLAVFPELFRFDYPYPKGETMNPHTIHELAETLSILCADETIADLLDATLSADDDPRLTDNQVDLADVLFDSLAEIRPDCVTLAQNRGQVVGLKLPKRTLLQRIMGV